MWGIQAEEGLLRSLGCWSPIAGSRAYEKPWRIVPGLPAGLKISTKNGCTKHRNTGGRGGGEWRLWWEFWGRLSLEAWGCAFVALVVFKLMRRRNALHACLVRRGARERTFGNGSSSSKREVGSGQ